MERKIEIAQIITVKILADFFFCCFTYGYRYIYILKQRIGIMWCL